MAVYGLRSRNLQPDEFYYGLFGARQLEHDFLGTLLAASPLARGPERLTSVVLALPDQIFAQTSNQLRADHVLLAVLYATAAIPVEALARGLGLRRRQSLLIAALAVVGPWMVFGTSILNTTLGYPLTMAFVWALWRTCLRPGVLADGLVLVVGALNATARAGHLPFLGVAAVAVLIQVWRDLPAQATWTGRLGRYPLALARRHPLLVAVGVALIAWVLVTGIYQIVGAQYAGAVPSHITLDQVLQRLSVVAAELEAGTGYLAVLLAVPWLVREALAPSRRETGTFAVIAVAMTAIFVVVTLNAPSDERYAAVLAGLPLIAFGVAVFHRRASPFWVAVTGLLVTRAVVTAGLLNDTGPFSYFFAPARQFFAAEVERRGGGLLTSVHTATAAMMVVVVVAVGLAWVCSPRARGRVALPRARLYAALAALGMLAVQATAGAYNVTRFSARATFPSLRLDDLTFVDRFSHGAPVVAWDYSPLFDGQLQYVLIQTLEFNRSIYGALHLKNHAISFECCAPISPDIAAVVDPPSGRLSTSIPLTPYLLEPSGLKTVGFNTTPVAVSHVFAGLTLERFTGRPRVTYSLVGLTPDSWLLPGASAVLRTYPPVEGSDPASGSAPAADSVAPAGSGLTARPARLRGSPGVPAAHCARVTLQGAPAGASHYVISAGAGRRTGYLLAGTQREVVVGLSATRVSTIELRASGPGRLPNGHRVTVGVAGVSLTPCRGYIVGSP